MSRRHITWNNNITIRNKRIRIKRKIRMIPILFDSRRVVTFCREEGYFRKAAHIATISHGSKFL